MNWVALQLIPRFPRLIQYIGPLSIVSFSSFVMNEKELYMEAVDPCLLMIGYISISFLSSCFLSINWETSSFFHIFSSILILKYFEAEFNYRKSKLGPTLLLLVVSCTLVAFTVEFKDKKEFIEKKKSERLQKDLKKILNNLPEGVIISTRSENAEILLSNVQACRLIENLGDSESN